jgi:hypothetical protein
LPPEAGTLCDDEVGDLFITDKNLRTMARLIAIILVPDEKAN